MAFIRKGARLTESTRPEFDRSYGPTETPVYPGIYQCDCGFEIIYTEGELPASDKFPNKHFDNHQHNWWLLVSIENPYRTIKYSPEKGEWE
jgi:hypothetical protein